MVLYRALIWAVKRDPYATFAEGLGHQSDLRSMAQGGVSASRITALELRGRHSRVHVKMACETSKLR